MRLSRRESLGFYIYATPVDQQQKDYNDSILMRAEIIRCRRQEAVINQEFGFLDRQQPKADFLRPSAAPGNGRCLFCISGVSSGEGVPSEI